MSIISWPGKEAANQAHLRTPLRGLELTNPSETAPVDLHADNLLVRGDNLEAVKALEPHLAGRAKLVYMDPPYNTGNQTWVYNDAMNASITKEWLGKVVGPDDQMRRHKWLTMMYPRLVAARNLLRPDWVHLGERPVGVRLLACV